LLVYIHSYKYKILKKWVQITKEIRFVICRDSGEIGYKLQMAYKGMFCIQIFLRIMNYIFSGLKQLKFNIFSGLNFVKVYTFSDLEYFQLD